MSQSPSILFKSLKDFYCDLEVFLDQTCAGCNDVVFSLEGAKSTFMTSLSGWNGINV